ncbi:ABC transporter ATP-binding protein [Enhygromyxa salina]|uniref:Putative ABC transporter ATP-binding protein YxlF n=1 Tax=Enhygromyxa salina TaxID=215803 RepID=A0A2S9XLP5_9BACT|nr:ABC transporter ATP-binding protein [Enhygromyxa salina]PRP93650.1 putative ABC transporter ATP-binding protein YxlF [Enhygromyxa salina]
MSNSLVIDNLSKTYGNGVRALRGVNLTIPTGMFGLLGPNGAGKSTLMRTISTLQDPDTGAIRLGDIDVLRDKDAVRRVLGYLPQDFGVYPNVDALTMLSHFATLKGIGNAKQRKQVVEALLQRVNLWDARKNKLGGYSGGMRQRFGIAQALLGNPRLIIVDEPTAGLDPEERNRFLNLLSEIGEHVVIILSTHIVEDVAQLCTNMAIIAKGEVLHQGKPLATIDEIRDKTWKKIIARDQLEAHERDHDVISTRLFSGRTLIHVVADAAPGDGFEPVEPGLEDVYFTTLSRSRAGDKADPAHPTRVA